jgi:uncharacterized protein YacL
MSDIQNMLTSKAFRQGASFGIISSAMTALGISLSEWSSNCQLKAIISSIIGLSISNALADGFSLYMSDRANGHDRRGLVSGGIVAIIEFIFPYMFLVPFTMFSKRVAVAVNAVLGIILVSVTGFAIGKTQDRTNEQLIEDQFLYIGATVVIMCLTYIGGKLASRVSG